METSLPDGAFLYVQPWGGADEGEQKGLSSVPRRFQYRDGDGNVDPALLRTARSEIEGSDLPPQTKRRLLRRAQRIAMHLLGHKGGSEPLEYKYLPMGEVEVKGKEGIVVGYAMAFGNTDYGDDVIYPGSAADSLNRMMPAVFYGHDKFKILGHPVQVKGDDTGYLTETQYNLKTFYGNEVFHLVEAGDIKHQSVGYLPADDTPEQKAVEYDDRGVRHLHRIDWFEYGPLPFALNPRAVLLGTKGMGVALDHDVSFSVLVEQAANVISDLAWEAEALHERRSERPSGWRGLNLKHQEVIEEFLSEAEACMNTLRTLTPTEQKGLGDSPAAPGGAETVQGLSVKMALVQARLRHAGILEGT